jgi:hypothetical protein
MQHVNACRYVRRAARVGALQGRRCIAHNSYPSLEPPVLLEQLRMPSPPFRPRLSEFLYMRLGRAEVHLGVG